MGERLQICIDKAVEVAVHDRLHIAVLAAGTVILHQRIRHKHVGTDLAAPLDFQLITLNIRDLLQVLALLDLNQLCTQHLHTVILVLELRTLCLAGNDNPRREMLQTHRRARLVDVLTARAAGAINLHFNILGADLNLNVIGKLRHDLQCRKRRMPSAGGVERGHTHQTVYARLGFQEAVSILALNHERRRLAAVYCSCLS